MSRIRSALLAGIAAGGFIPIPALAVDAIWTGPGSEWIGAGNWSGGVIPDGTATLGGQPQHAITADGDNTIGSIVIGAGAPAYRITVGGVASFVVDGTGIVNAPGSGTLTFQNNGELGFVAGSTAGHSIIGNDGWLLFDDTATAGDATITNGALSTLTFAGGSSAGSAAIVNNGGLLFTDGSTAGNATITTAGGAATYFGDLIVGGTADGGHAIFITEAGGMVDFSTTRGANNDGQISAGSIEGAGNYFIGHGNTLTVGGNNRSTEVRGLIADDCSCSPGAGGTLVKDGTGTLTLSGANSYSGGTVIAGGTLRVEHNNALGRGALTTTGSTLDYANGVDIGNDIIVNSNATKLQVLTGTATQSGDISETGGARGIEKSGAGTLVLSGNNSYTGQTKITAGTLLAATDTALAEDTDVVIGSGASLAIDDGIVTDINSLSGAGDVLIGTADPSTVLGIGIAGGATTTFSGSIVGAGSLELLGGTLTLTGDSNIDGSLWVCDCSTLTIDGGSFAAATDIEVGGELDVANGGRLETGQLAIAGTMRVDGRGSTVRNDQGGPLGGPGITVVAGRLDVTDGATLETDVLGVGGTMRIAGPGSVVTASPDGATFISDLGGPGLLSIEDGGVLNSRGGAVIGAMPDDNPTVRVSGAGSTWNVDKGLSVGLFTAPATLTITDGAVVNSTGITAIGDGSTVNLGTGDVAGTIVAPEILNNGKIRANFIGTSTLSATIWGVGSLVKSGAGTLVLSGENGYSGGTTLAGGTLRVEHDNALGTGALTTTGSTLDYANGIDIGNDIVVNSNATKLQVLTGTATQSGDISETGGKRGIEKTGAGMLVLAGRNSYSGRTTITAGTLLAATNTALAKATNVVVGSDGTLAIEDGIFTDINSLSGSGSVLIGMSDSDTILSVGSAGGAATRFSGTLLGEGSLDIAGGTLTFAGEGYIGGWLGVCACSALIVDGGAFTAASGVAVGGKLDVTNGGIVKTEMLNVAGTMRIVGRGSMVTVSERGATFVEGSLGPALLSIEDGGVLDSKGSAVIGAAPSRSATVSVTGAGSRWNVGNGLAVGVSGAPGTLTIANGGVVHSNGFTGIGRDSTLNLGTGGVAGVIVTAAILNDGEIKANFTNTSTLAADIRGGGSLFKTGAGILVLSGGSSYTGATTVDSGGLVVNGSIGGSQVTVNDGATLGGSGTVGATTINDGGAIAPGNSIGVLTVAGDLTFASGSLYTLEVSTNGADRINVAAGNGDTGLARLVGGTVRAVYVPGSYIAKRYVILHAEGGLGGTRFAGLTGSAPTGFKTSLSYDPNTVWLDLDLAMRQYSGLNRNQQHVADALTGFFDRTGGIPAEFAALTPQGLTLASGEVATSSIGAGLYAADRFLEVITDPFVAGRGVRVDGTVGPSAGPRQKVWGAVYGGTLSIDGDAIVGSHDTTQRVHGIAAGYDHDMGDGVWGFGLGGADASFDLADGLGSGDTGIFNAGLYATQDFGQAYLTGALAYGWNSVSTTRAVGGDELSADFDAQTLSGRIETGYRFDTAALGVTPYAAFQAGSFFLPGYEESAAGAGTFALSYDGRTTTATRIELGARFDKSLAVSDSALLTLRGRAAWVHDGNTDRSVTAVFQDLPGAAFIVDGAARAHDSGLINASAEITWTNGFSAGASFQGEFSSNASSLSGSAKLSYRW